jgi:hypothetical protein
MGGALVKALLLRAMTVYFLMSLLAFPSIASGKKLTDDQIRKAIIQESISSYPGTCPCPYNITRNGSRCGRRSAYSRPGGYSPLCYPSDVTDDMVEKYRKKHE